MVLEEFFVLAGVYPAVTSFTVCRLDQWGECFFGVGDGLAVLDMTNEEWGHIVARYRRESLHYPAFVKLSGVLVELVISKIFVLRSSLNGNNGEATNDDDLMRNHNVRPGARHQRPVAGGRNDPNDMARRQPGGQHGARAGEGNAGNAGRRVAEEERRRQADLELAERRRLAEQERTEKIIYCTHLHLGWDGEQFYQRVNDDCIGLLNGDKYRASNPFQVFTNVCKSETGFLIRYVHDQPEKQLRNTCIRSPWDDLVVDGEFDWEGHRFERTEYTVFLPALHFIRKKFSSIVISESMVNGIVAGINKAFGLEDYPQVNLMPTVKYYIHLAHKTNYTIARDFVTKGKPIVKNRVEESYSSSLNIQRSEKDVVVFRSQDCEVPDTYCGRTDCCITVNGLKWCGVSQNLFDRNDPRTYPFFATAAPDANSEKYYRSVFCRFDGNAVPPFVTYSVNARNACKALKRMAGARETQAYDHYLSSMQYACYGEILSRNYDVREYISEHHEFFSAGRAAVETRADQANGAVVISKFIVGYDNWRVSDDHPNHKLTYVTPFAVRPPSFHVQPLADNNHGTMDRPYRQTTLSDVFGAGGFYNLLNYSQEFGAALRPWMNPDAYVDLATYTGDAVELNAVYQFMADSFKALKEKHNRVVIDEYAKNNRDWLYLEGYEKFLTMMDCETDRCWHASIKHVKKALRQMYVEQQFVHLPTEIMVKTVNAKVKKEFAKFGKVPRLFVTYDAGCMFANELPEYSKVCLDGSYSWKYRNVTARVVIFAKPSSEKLKIELQNCINAMRSRNHFNVLIYSDDSVWSGNLNGVDFAFNVDISSCDSGNKLGTFGLVYDLLREFRSDLALGLMRQCSNVINLVNPEDRNEVMRIEMATFFEGSGTVLTTILNHVAMYMIGSAAISLFGCRAHCIRDWKDIRRVIIESGVLFGHVLTVDACLDEDSFVPEKIQFLKRSPLQTLKGDYIPCLNYGTIFRGFGSLEGDMVADMVGLSVEEFKVMDWSERWDLFASRVIAGLVNEPSSVILKALRSRFSHTPRHHSAWSELTFAKERIQYGGIIEAGEGNNGEDIIDDLSLARRYGCTVYDLEVLASQIANSKFGDVYPSEAVSAFAEVDYGVGRL